MVAFSRRDTVVVVPRLVIGVADDWHDTVAELPDGEWHDVITGARITGGGPVAVADLLAAFPVAVLARIN